MLKEDDPDAWRQFADLYGPLVYYWCRGFGLQPQDAADVFQEVFGAVVRAVGDFKHEGGTFRGWLWTIVRNKVRDHHRRQADRGVAIGGSVALQRLAELPEIIPESMSGDDRDEINSLLHRALDNVRTQVEQRTWQAFWLAAVEGVEVANIASDLEMSSNNVRQAKCRVLRRLREEIGDLQQ